MTIYKRLSEVPATSKTPSSLPPEVEEGNVEYKLKLVDPSESRIEHLITQMNWRLKEGDGKAYYAIGVEDNGTVSGLSQQELQSSLQTLKNMAHKLGAEIEVRIISSVQEGRHAADVMVKKVPDKQEFKNIRVACVGNVDVGKSTLLSVLSHGGLDNGRGCARLNMFRHLHEIQTGHTSSISHQMLGFNSAGEELNSNDLTAEEICSSAAKLITFLDLAGHQKYLKTTILGLTGYSPDIVMLVVAANRGIAGTTREHLGLVIALKIPFVIVVTKTDISAEEVTNRTVEQLKRILKCSKDPLLVQSIDDVTYASDNFSTVTPIFTVSSVNGQHLELLRKFYSVLPPLKTETEQKSLIDRPPQFQVDEVYSVCEVGQVVGGTLRYGQISMGDELVVGPMSDGSFQPVMVASLHRNRTPCRHIQAGQTACIAFDGYDIDDYCFRRGQVLLQNVNPPKPSKKFQAELLLLFHTTKINVRFQATLHIGNIVQTAIVKEIIGEEKSVQTGQKAKVVFEFMKQAEYIENGDQIFFREGRSKGIGKVIELFS